MAFPYYTEVYSEDNKITNIYDLYKSKNEYFQNCLDQNGEIHEKIRFDIVRVKKLKKIYQIKNFLGSLSVSGDQKIGLINEANRESNVVYDECDKLTNRKFKHIGILGILGKYKTDDAASITYNILLSFYDESFVSPLRRLYDKKSDAAVRSNWLVDEKSKIISISNWDHLNKDKMFINNVFIKSTSDESSMMFSLTSIPYSLFGYFSNYNRLIQEFSSFSDNLKKKSEMLINILKKISETEPDDGKIHVKTISSGFASTTVQSVSDEPTHCYDFVLNKDFLRDNPQYKNKEFTFPVNGSQIPTLIKS